jgi:Spy/CpxP family protein refolding chaperone
MKKLGMFAFALVMAASNAWAFGGGCGMGMGPGLGMNPQWASNLNLTAEQKTQLQARHEAFAAEIEPLRNEMFTKREELRQLWANPNPDQAMISAKQREIRELQGQIQDKATQQRLGCLEVLTPEQREKLGTLTAQCGWKGGRGRGCGQGMGHGPGMGMGRQ